MNFAELGRMVAAQGAPVIGGLLGGAVAGSAGAAIGSRIGGVIAEAFGLPDTASPSEISLAIEADPLAGEKLAALESEKAAALQAEYQAMLAALQAVNETMRAELVSGTPWQRNWRPLNGYALAVVTLASTLCALASIFTGHAIDAANIVETLIPVIAISGGVAGVTAFGRSWEKRAAL